jgi:hypothetical protein
MTTEIETPPEDASEGTEFKDEGPRQHMKDVEAQNKTLRQRELGRSIADIGLDAKEGLGLAIAEAYKGDFSDGDVAAFAKDKYSHEFESGEPANETAETLATQEEASAAVQQSSAPVTPPTTAGDIEELDNALADSEVDGPAVSKISIERKLAGYVGGEYRGNPIQT